MALTRIGTRGRVLCPGRMCSHLRLTMLPAFAITAPCVLLQVMISNSHPRCSGDDIIAASFLTAAITVIASSSAR